MIIRLITMAYPCSACLIADGLLRSLLQKIAEQMDNIEIKIEELHHPKECANVTGLEVEKLPAIIIDDEQITAGNLLHRRQLINIIESRTAQEEATKYIEARQDTDNNKARYIEAQSRIHRGTKQNI